MANEERHFPISVILTVRDPKASIAYYRDKLGFQLEACWPDDQNPMWANLMLAGQSMMIGTNMQASDIAEWCKTDDAKREYKLRLSNEFTKNKHGVGIATYISVPDVDAFHSTITKKGVKVTTAPKTQFYGIRELVLEDPDGYTFMFYTTVKMENCQSCGMPLTDAKPGQMYCGYCVDEKGRLKPYETVLEGCIEGYFIPMQKLTRPQAEKAARDLLAKQPAWVGRG